MANYDTLSASDLASFTLIGVRIPDNVDPKKLDAAIALMMLRHPATVQREPESEILEPESPEPKKREPKAKRKALPSGPVVPAKKQRTAEPEPEPKAEPAGPSDPAAQPAASLSKRQPKKPFEKKPPCEDKPTPVVLAELARLGLVAGEYNEVEAGPDQEPPPRHDSKRPSWKWVMYAILRRTDALTKQEIYDLAVAWDPRLVCSNGADPTSTCRSILTRSEEFINLLDKSTWQIAKLGEAKPRSTS